MVIQIFDLGESTFNQQRQSSETHVEELCGQFGASAVHREQTRLLSDELHVGIPRSHLPSLVDVEYGFELFQRQPGH